MRLNVFRPLWLILLIGLVCTARAEAKAHLLVGRTMGTTYHIKIIAPASDDMDAVHRKIDRRLEQINQSMSTFRKESEISRFNRTTHTGKPFAVSPDFLKVMQVAGTIYDETGGAWDGTVLPLIELWGFGRSAPIDKMPSQAAIGKAMEDVGFRNIEVSADGFLKKRRPHVTVDLASIAKGYGVDSVAAVVRESGYRNYLVEIGGEVYAAGHKPDDQPWRVGINRPQKGVAATAVYEALNLEDRAMATSGDYRNYEEIGGRAYSHIIDPRSGYPIHNGVVSTSVIAPNCTLADGLATALMVMGPEAGIRLLNRLEKVEGLIIVRKPDGTLVDHWSDGMAPSP
jgi:thiamine biosynthesis lipoprotein